MMTKQDIADLFMQAFVRNVKLLNENRYSHTKYGFEYGSVMREMAEFHAVTLAVTLAEVLDAFSARDAMPSPQIYTEFAHEDDKRSETPSSA